MNGMRKVLGFVMMAFMLAAFALPSSAAPPSKIFGLVMSPSTVTTSSVTLTATFSNATPTGNSVINTVILTPPAGVTVTGTSFPNGGNKVQCPANTVNSSGQTVPVPPGSICVANIPSVMKAGCTPTACSWAMTVTATLPGTSCVYTWAGQAFAGNSFNGDVFAFQSGASSVTTSVSPTGQQTVFSTQPANTTLGSATPVAVTLSSSCGPAPGVLVTITAPACTGTCVLSGNTATTNGSGVASFPGLTINKVGTYTLSASGSGFPAANSNSFTVFAGILGCSNVPENNFDSSKGKIDHSYDPYGTGPFIGDSGWGLRRGKNWDGLVVDNCILVNYTFTLDPTNITTFLWDKATGQHPVFEYVIVWNPVGVDASDGGNPVDAQGWTQRRPLVSWTTVTEYIPALACLVDDDQIGKAAFPVIPNVLPFSNYPVGHPYHPDGTNQALLCVAQQGWTAVGGGFVQYWTKVLDAADSTVKFP